MPERFKLKFAGGLYALALGQMITALVIIIISLVVFATVQVKFRTLTIGIDGSGIWGGAILLLIGVFGYRAVTGGEKELNIGYLGAAIVAAVLAGVMALVALHWAHVSNEAIDRRPNIPSESLEVTPGAAKFVIVLEALIALFGATHGVMAIVSSSLLCSSVCQEPNMRPPPAIQRPPSGDVYGRPASFATGVQRRTVAQPRENEHYHGLR